jgi:hypothetical protein
MTVFFKNQIMMKNIFIPICLLVIVTIYKSNAQAIYVGIHGGFLKNATIIENNSSFLPPWNKERLNTFNRGLNVGYQLSKRWNIETQLQFVNLTYKERLDLLYDFHSGPIAGTMLAEIDWYTQHHYIRMPLLAYYNFMSETSKLGVSLFAGPNIGFQTKQTSTFMGVNEFSRSKQNSLNIENIPLKKLDIGLQLGIRVTTKLYKSFYAYLDGTMYQGFPSIVDYPKQTYIKRPTQNYEYYNIINRHFTINVGVLYDL